MEKFIFNRSDNLQLILSDSETKKLLAMGTEDDVDIIKNMIMEAQEIANPKAIYCIVPIMEKSQDSVTIENIKIISSLMRKNFDKVNRVFPYVATCGVELEEWSKTYTDLIEQFWADEIKKIYLGKAILNLRNKIKELYALKDILSAMNPGSIKEWALSGQKQLFEIIGSVTEDIGVTLTKSMLMLPSKSVSGIFFTSETEYENCTLCPIITCPNRRAEYIQKG